MSYIYIFQNVIVYQAMAVVVYDEGVDCCGHETDAWRNYLSVAACQIITVIQS